MNLFKGLTDHQIISFILMFGLFNAFVVLLAVALAAFFLSSKPVRGRVPRAPIWHVAAAFWFMLSLVSTVWAAPAEKSFVNGDRLFDLGYDRFQKVVIGVGFAAVGVVCLAVGVLAGLRERRAWREEVAAA